MLCKQNPSVLKATGICRPEGELDSVLKSATAEDLKGKMWHIEGEPSWKGLVEPQRPHFDSDATGDRSPTPSEFTNYQI